MTLKIWTFQYAYKSLLSRIEEKKMYIVFPRPRKLSFITMKCKYRIHRLYSNLLFTSIVTVHEIVHFFCNVLWGATAIPVTVNHHFIIFILQFHQHFIDLKAFLASSRNLLSKKPYTKGFTILFITFISRISENTVNSVFVLFTQKFVSPMPTNNRMNCGRYDTMNASAMTMNI